MKEQQSCSSSTLNACALCSIGLMIAQAFAANGAKVYITSRTKEVLERSAEVHSHGGDHKGQIIDAGVSCGQIWWRRVDNSA